MRTNKNIRVFCADSIKYQYAYEQKYFFHTNGMLLTAIECQNLMEF